MSSLLRDASFRVDSPLVVYEDDCIKSSYTYKSTLYDENTHKVSIAHEELVFRTSTVVPRLGVMLVGWGGNNGTTLTAGCIANRLGLSWNTKEGKVTSNFYGSLTQASTIRLAMNANTGQHVHIPFKDILPMVHPNDIVFGGWDISAMNLGDAMTRAKVLDYDLQRQLYEPMSGMTPLPGIYNSDFIACNQSDRADNTLTGTAYENMLVIRQNISDFRRVNALDKVVVMWTATTERFAEVALGLNDSAASLLKSIEVPHTLAYLHTYILTYLHIHV